MDFERKKRFWRGVNAATALGILLSLDIGSGLRAVTAQRITPSLFGNPDASPWQSLTQPSNFFSCDVNLMTDGTIVDHDFRFTPDINGSYVNGTWSPIAPMPSGYRPGAFAAAVLPDGRLIYEGGEVNNGVLNFTNLGAIFDPVANSWTPVAPPSGWSTIGGAPSVVLADGTFMIGRAGSNGGPSGTREQALLNAANLTWTPTGSGKADANFEEGWTLLPDGSVMAIDNNPPGNPTLSERYDPRTGAWTSAGSTTVRLSDSLEMGPQLLRPDGSVIVFGALSSGVDHTAIYHSASGTWTAGPDLPTINGQTYTMNDGPAALLPSGNVLFAASPSPGHGQTPVHFFEFDGTNIIQVADPVGAASIANEFTQMLVLPTGQIFVTFCALSSLPQIYTPSGSPNPAWAPSISSVPSVLMAGATYSISGTQFSGLSQGSAYGDEAQQDTNFPLVQITNGASGHVFYARTFGHSTRSVAPNTAGSTNFTVPRNIEAGPSTLVVIANGISSQRVSVNLTLATSGPAVIPSKLVGGVSCTQPTAPSRLIASVGRYTATLLWNPGASATSYVVEAGSSPGLSNVAVIDTGSANTSLTLTVPSARYFVRVRAKNACGSSSASNETVIVGS